MLTTGKPKTIIGTGNGGGSNNLPILPIQEQNQLTKNLIIQNQKIIFLILKLIMLEVYLVE